jgi:hypothetical protein
VNCMIKARTAEKHEATRFGLISSMQAFGCGESGGGLIPKLMLIVPRGDCRDT